MALCTTGTSCPRKALWRLAADRCNNAPVPPLASALAAALVAVFVSITPAHAQEASERSVRTTILRSSEGVSPEIAETVDGTLVRELREVAGIDSPTLSPVDYDEIATAAGCAERDAACLSSILSTIDADALLVRTLRVGAAGGQISLTHFASEDEAISEVSRELDAGDEAPDALIPSMVRELFHIPDAPGLRERRESTETAPGDGAEATAGSQASGGGGVSAWPFVVLGAGALAAGAGVLFGALSQSSEDEYAGVAVQTPADADRASDLLAQAEDQALLANVLFIAGGAVGLLGLTWMIVDLATSSSGEGGGEAEVAVGAFVAPNGAILSLSGRFGARP
jgi:hypothetical protein